MSKITGQILQWHQEFGDYIAYLKSIAPVYPDMVFHTAGDTLYVATWLRVERDGQYRLIPCIDSVHSSGPIANQHPMPPHERLHRIFARKCYEAQFLYVASKEGSPLDPIDPNQEPEETRLMKIINSTFTKINNPPL